MPRSSSRRSSSRSTKPSRPSSTTSARRDRAPKSKTSSKSKTQTKTPRRSRSRDVSSTRTRRTSSGGTSRSARKKRRLVLVVIAMVAFGYGGVMLGDSLIGAAKQIDSSSWGDMWEKMKTRLFDNDIPRRTPKKKKSDVAKAPKAPVIPVKEQAPELETKPQPASARAELPVPPNPAEYQRATQGAQRTSDGSEEARRRLDALLGH